MFASIGMAHDGKKLPVITPIRYRPGERHVLRYEIPVSVAREQRLYAKLYKDRQDAARAFGVANRVVDWLDAHPEGLQGNRPEAMSQEDCVILYPHAPGVPLSHQLHRSPRWLASQLKIIGRALATMHSGPEALQAGLKENTFANEAKVVKRASEHIQVLLPGAYEKIVNILDTVQKQYADLPQEKPTFTHSDFKADHLLSTPQGLTLIDLDTCTLTDPALDLGKFLADLEWWFELKGLSGVEDAQAELLKGYVGANAGDPVIAERLRRARLFHILILVKIVARRVPIYKKEWGAMTARLVDRAAHKPNQAIEV
jgi:Ser/Thr protein kinase RdoA (MazF antagonist)